MLQGQRKFLRAWKCGWVELWKRSGARCWPSPAVGWGPRRGAWTLESSQPSSIHVWDGVHVYVQVGESKGGKDGLSSRSLGSLSFLCLGKLPQLLHKGPAPCILPSSSRETLAEQPGLPEMETRAFCPAVAWAPPVATRPVSPLFNPGALSEPVFGRNMSNLNLIFLVCSPSRSTVAKSST